MSLDRTQAYGQTATEFPYVATVGKHNQELEIKQELTMI